MNMKMRYLLLVLLISAFSCATALAQGIGQINGNVADPAGHALIRDHDGIGGAGFDSDHGLDRVGPDCGGQVIACLRLSVHERGNRERFSLKEAQTFRRRSPAVLPTQGFMAANCVC
jgi:hypothetical protein